VPKGRAADAHTQPCRGYKTHGHSGADSPSTGTG